ncbi:MAG: hypothetical protein JXB07_06655 [Anaerolineae bacterium]|nr:hypothetical protein [Anaerolineae bacterium]
MKAEKNRMQAKTAEQRFRHLLETEYAFSSKMAELLMEEVQQYLVGRQRI